MMEEEGVVEEEQVVVTLISPPRVEVGTGSRPPGAAATKMKPMLVLREFLIRITTF